MIFRCCAEDAHQSECGQSVKSSRQLSIVGTRGIPARHGGFETFAERLALHLTSRGWEVSVYCQLDGPGKRSEDHWRGIKRIKIPVTAQGAPGTMIFDWKSTWHASRKSRLVLTLGYNTAIFSLLYRIKGIPNIINMDGLEWQRAKWGPLEKTWLYLNDRVARRLANHLIADHPKIESYLREITPQDKITMIPYGADTIKDADVSLIEALDLRPGQYCLVIARLEPENSILEIVTAFSSKQRGQQLIILGDFNPEQRPFHRSLSAAGSEEVRFVGAIHDQPAVASLRHFATLYIHGHTVGGTNPSLVAAMGADVPVLAHDNGFNRWVCGGSAVYFDSEPELSLLLDRLLEDNKEFKEQAAALLERQRSQFCWDDILSSYDACLTRWL
jgi:glycosyltransferase involved in cell wall biosynthesis